jgi:hypothetical protein
MYFVRLTESWYALSPAEQDSLIAKVDAARAQVGGKTVVACDSAWSSEQWPTFGIEMYPSMEAVQKHAAILTDLNWYTYVESKSVLGMDPADFAKVTT